ncbi:MAG: hypothetical protein H6825_02835 [Planctomycetes bacterium]|nr:hypothetical protein [Planctomycetota bacterium]
MTTPKISHPTVAAALCVLALLCSPLRAGDDSAARGAPAAKAQDATSAVDAPLGVQRLELLQVAFDAASAMPLEPHLKDRSRAQESVVDACLELDQPTLARRFSDGIANWRRGIALADHAAWSARHGVHDGLDAQLESALDIARGDDPELLQDWRRDRIRAHVAQARLLLGEDVTGLTEHLSDSEIGLLWVARAETVGADGVGAFLDELDASLTAGTLDRVRNALTACLEVRKRFDDDAALRARIGEAFDAAAPKLPRGMAIDLEFQLARIALDHGDLPGAQKALADARAMVQGARWTAEDHVPLLARLGALRFLCGDREQGRVEVDAARVIYDDERKTIVDIFRAGALRPLAEAYLDLGDVDAAREIYSLALDEAVVNPNSRPRAEDLVEICLSMARRDFDPGAALLDHVHAVRGGLADPW